ncbi:MAG: hypothetical protein QM755_06650 [Luteolibacter sp.]
MRKESRAKVLLVRTIALAAVAGLGLVVFVVVGILRTKDEGTQAWRDPNVSNYRNYEGAKKVREFPTPDSERVVAIVRKVLAMRKAEDFKDLVRLKGISEAEAVDFLTRLPERSGRVTEVTWQNTDGANELQLESAIVKFERGVPRTAYLTPDDAGVWQVDLAAFAAHGSVGWDEFQAGGERSVELRVIAARDTYYNGAYSDDHAWSCYTLAYPGADSKLIGYAKKNGPVDEALTRILKNRVGFPVVVRVSKNSGAAGRQVEILAVPAEGWVLTDQSFDGGSHSEAPSEGK